MCRTSTDGYASRISRRITSAWSTAAHAKIGVTMNTYAHVLSVLRQEAAAAIDELFGA
jgi:hypothetical protein